MCGHSVATEKKKVHSFFASIEQPRHPEQPRHTGYKYDYMGRFYTQEGRPVTAVLRIAQYDVQNSSRAFVSRPQEKDDPTQREKRECDTQNA
jgi:hypothetical protein